MRRVEAAAINRAETITVPPWAPPKPTREPLCSGGDQPMSIFAHAEAAIAASKRCPTCRHLEATIADLQAWVEDLRQSRDHWRDLALDARDIALEAERAAADAALALSKEMRS